MTQVVKRIGGRFTLQETLGGTGLASVYRGLEVSNGSEVAIKVLRSYFTQEPGLVHSYFEELKRVQGLRDQRLLAPLDMGQDEEGAWVAYPHVSWPTLEQVLSRGPIPPGSALTILRQIAEVLDGAHAQGVWHGDLKPTNLFVGPGGEVRVADFGMFILAAGAHPLIRSSLNTPHPSYTAPELDQDPAPDAASDQYSLGAIAYEMLTGRLPFSALGAATIQAQKVTSAPKPPTGVNPRLPPECDRPLLRALARHPLERYQRLGDFVDALEEALGVAAAPSGVGLSGLGAVQEAADEAGPAVGAPAEAWDPEDAVFCPSCGEPNAPDALNCQSCWARIKDRRLLSLDQAIALRGFWRRQVRVRRAIRLSLLGAALAYLAFLVGDFFYDAPVPRPISDVTSVSAAGESAMYGLNPARTGAAAQGPTLRGELRWRFETDAPLLASPAVVDGVVYQPTGDRRIVALSAQDGSLLWERPTSGPVDSSPAVVDGLVYYGQRDGQMLALDQKTGELVWSTDLAPILGGPVVYRGVVYVGGGDGFLHALDAKTGDPLWNFEAGGWLVGGMPVNDRVIAVTNSSGDIRIVDIKTGQQRLFYDAVNSVAGNVVLQGDRLFLTTLAGRVAAVDWQKREIPYERSLLRWRLQFWVWGLTDAVPRQKGLVWQKGLGRRTRASAPVVLEDTLYVATHRGKLLAMDTGSGAVRWEYDAGQPIFSSPAVAGAVAYIGTDEGTLHAVNRTTGEPLWTFTMGGRLRNRPVIAGDSIFVASEDGSLYAIR